VGEVGRAVQRVQNPADIRGARVVPPLLREDAVGGKAGADALHEQGLRAAVPVGDQVDDSLVVNRPGAGLKLPQERARGAGGLNGGRQDIGHHGSFPFPGTAL